jgi:hypothetical protein
MAIEPQELRRVMGHFATGVTVITTQDKDGNPNGLTANAFMSLSLNPPLVLISVDKSAQCYACFNLQNGFTVNLTACSGIPARMGQRFSTRRSAMLSAKLRSATRAAIIPSLSAKSSTPMPQANGHCFFLKENTSVSPILSFSSSDSSSVETFLP